MLIEKVIGNIGDTEEVSGKRIEWVDLEWEELSKRILRTETNEGTDVALRIDQEEPLKYGDLLFEDDERCIVIRTKVEQVIVIRPKDMVEMGKAAFELGNRHTPALIEKDEIVVRADHTLAPLLDEVGVAYETTERRFKQPFKYRGHSH
ncbi:urease accessory protein UreE [Sporosarcina thermotolerans]|uniref:Urease accessory protein UreE n=1 Tax=Sporosarcina thermotolerans TaxID=633404 RepID=A0AAW9A5W9_9BACL|nr:urease accessory protein UreE [Sporosarcina thermotolerans]MDW0116622.1 urease accessory protein UreE [Sporosarcina thermotolerans]WHT48827.1 urease accessory protein UreE [Sporosarcina thermotolerans]